MLIQQFKLIYVLYIEEGFVSLYSLLHFGVKKYMIYASKYHICRCRNYTKSSFQCYIFCGRFQFVGETSGIIRRQSVK